MFCPNCGQETPAPSFCNSCGWREHSADPMDDPAMRLLIPVATSGWAIAAGYLALFSVLVFPAPFALGAGVLGLSSIKKNPNLGGKGRAIFGIVMGSIFTLVLLAFIFMTIAAIALE